MSGEKRLSPWELKLHWQVHQSYGLSSWRVSRWWLGTIWDKTGPISFIVQQFQLKPKCLSGTLPPKSPCLQGCSSQRCGSFSSNRKLVPCRKSGTIMLLIFNFTTPWSENLFFWWPRVVWFCLIYLSACFMVFLWYKKCSKGTFLRKFYWTFNSKKSSISSPPLFFFPPLFFPSLFNNC